MTSSPAGTGPLSTIVVQPREPVVAEVLRLGADRGFGLECVDFADPAVLAGEHEALVDRWRELMPGSPGGGWVHGPYYDLYVNSPDPDVRRLSEYRIHQALEISDRIGARYCVFHTNHLPCVPGGGYTERWLADNAAFWAAACRAHDVRVLVENMWDADPSLLRRLVSAVPELRVCLDVGHAHLFSGVPLAEWFRALADSIEYVHLSDNAGDADSALPPGRGTIDWAEYDTAVRAAPLRPAVMLGIAFGGILAIDETLDYLRRHRIYPFPAAGPDGTERR